MNKLKNLLLTLVYFTASVCLADSLKLAIENDVFIHDDSDYSHGTEIVYARESPVWLFDGWGIDVLQNMYTPNDISSPYIQAASGDRPYCGLFLASVFGDNSWEFFKNSTLNVRHEFGIGSTGEGSGAETSQKFVHKIIGSKEPKGWDHQIKQEIIAQYQGYVDYNMPVIDTKWFSLYDVWRGNLFAGTYKDQIALGTDFKLGFNPKQEKGGDIAFSAAPGMKKNSTKKFGLSLIGGVEAKYVLWDMSLDGGFFRDSEYTVDSKDFVGEVHYGFEAEIFGFEVDFLMVNRTKEYEYQDEAPDYCRLAVSYNW